MFNNYPCLLMSISPAQTALMRSGVNSVGDLDPASTFILMNGWAAATTRQYAAAVNKYLTFLKWKGNYDVALPSSAQNIYDFILWCSSSSSKPVLSRTTTRYLTGLRMWHALHDSPFPTVNLHRVRLLLKGCTKLELRPASRKQA